jgi:acyl-coenzyme A thioesterase PaaI-like protein
MKEIMRYPGCFVCGDKNEIGLQAQFFWDGDKAVCDIAALELYAGYKDIFHGGVLSALLDEIMVKALLAQDIPSVTAEMTVRYRQPVFCGDRLHLEGRQTGHKGVVFFTEGTAVNQNGEVVATATGKYVRPKQELGEKLLESLT